MDLHALDDASLFAHLRSHLFSAVIGDILDSMGHHHQCLPPTIQPLDLRSVVVGRAMPVLEADLPADYDGPPFGCMLEALDSLKPGEVYIASGGSPRYAFWGGLMSKRALHLRSAGAVLYGYSRDTRDILDLGFPVFSLGRYAQDQLVRGYVKAFGVPITIEEVSIHPGDLIFGDLDGIMVVPRALEHEVLDRALEKVGKEDTVRRAIEEGVSTAAAFLKHGVM